MIFVCRMRDSEEQGRLLGILESRNQTILITGM